MSNYDQRGLADHLNKESEQTHDDMRDELAGFYSDLPPRARVHDIRLLLSELSDAQIDYIYGRTDFDDTEEMP